MLETRESITEVEPRRGRARRFGGKPGVALFIFAISAVASLPFFFITNVPPGQSWWSPRMPITHDMHLHFEQMKSFHAGIASGELYPRWEEDTNRGFGAPTPSYYPPGVYYLTSAMYALAGDWIIGLMGAHYFMMLASVAALYLYARRVLSRAGACVAAAAYGLLPYHLLDQYQRGAIAELLGFIWMPLMLMFAENLFRAGSEEVHDTRDWRSNIGFNLAGLGASYGAFVWSHPPTAYQFGLAFGVTMLALALRRKDFRGLVLAGAGGLLGVALGAAYLLPAALEQDFITHEYVSETWPYHASYVFLHALPYSQGHWGFFNLLDSIWSHSIVVTLLGGWALWRARRSGWITAELAERVTTWVVLGAFAALMMNLVSYPFGRYIPKIDIGVFTWRMLSISTLSAALITGACWEAVRGARRGLKLALAGLAGLSLIGGILLSGFAVVAPMVRSGYFVASLEHVNFAMIPKTAFDDPLRLPMEERVSIEDGSGEVEIERWAPEHRTFRVTIESAARVRVRTFYFPGWTATVDGRPVEIEIGRHGAITFNLEAGTHHIRLDYLNTPVRRGAGYLTIGAAVLTAMLFGGPLLRRHRDRNRP